MKLTVLIILAGLLALTGLLSATTDIWRDGTVGRDFIVQATDPNREVRP